jgi:hypothetical protein
LSDASTAPALLPADPHTERVAGEVGGQPWDELDPHERPSLRLPIPLNRRQYEQLKYLSELEDRSLAKILSRLLGPVLDEAVRQADA